MKDFNIRTSGHDEWLTPPEIIKALGTFDLDPCSPIHRPWPTATNHYTVENDGFNLPWYGRVWGAQYCGPSKQWSSRKTGCATMKLYTGDRVIDRRRGRELCLSHRASVAGRKNGKLFEVTNRSDGCSASSFFDFCEPLRSHFTIPEA